MTHSAWGMILHPLPLHSGQKILRILSPLRELYPWLDGSPVSAPQGEFCTEMRRALLRQVTSEFVLLPLAWLSQRKIKFSQSDRLWASQTQTSLWGGRNTEKGTFQEARLLFMELLRSRKVFVELYLGFLPVGKEAWAQVSPCIEAQRHHIFSDQDVSSYLHHLLVGWLDCL